jgi:hypothetical protein
MSEQPALFDDKELKGVIEPNPCVKLYGPGPAGARCHTCANLVSFQYSNKFFKCYLRRAPNGGRGGPATDHRARWNACGKYQQGQGKEVYGSK